MILLNVSTNFLVMYMIVSKNKSVTLMKIVCGPNNMVSVGIQLQDMMKVWVVLKKKKCNTGRLLMMVMVIIILKNNGKRNANASVDGNTSMMTIQDVTLTC